MKRESLWDIYDDIMQDNTRWCYFTEMHPEQTSHDLFSGTNALEYIKSTFDLGGKNGVLSVLNSKNFEMTQYRSNHTLSAYLLGIALRDRLNIDMKELPKISDRPTRNFLYFWSLTCLFHDFAYCIEEKSKEKNSEYWMKLETLEEFIEFFEIKYSLLDYTDSNLLIKNYYRYIREKFKHVDHGIAGAMLFFDAMMKDYNDAKSQSGIKNKVTFNWNGKKYSKDYIKHTMLISVTIAKHNMWYSTSENEAEYENYNLNELISRKDGSHLLSIDDKSEDDKEKLLFLLEFVDTIEPIKILGRQENKMPIKNPYIVLEKIKVRFLSQQKRVIINCPSKYREDYLNSIRGITHWMNVDLTSADDEIVITIMKRSPQMLAVA